MSWLVFNKSLIIAAADVYNGWRVGSWQIISFHLPKNPDIPIKISQKWIDKLDKIESG